MLTLMHFGTATISVFVQDGPLRTNDNTQHHSLHAEQTADKVASDSTPSTVQATPEKEDGVKTDDDDASIQSPASTLADTLSLLSLSTPAAVEYKSSRLGQNGQQSEDESHHASSQTAVSQTKGKSDQSDASRIAVRTPAKPQEGDVSVGLVYDAIMEEHKGPPGETIQSIFSFSNLQVSCLPCHEGYASKGLTLDKSFYCFRSVCALSIYLMAGHVERPQRTAVLVERLKETGLADRCWHVPARQVTSMLIPQFHPPTTPCIGEWHPATEYA